MPLVEDFHFSHEGVPPWESFAALEKVRPLSSSKPKSTQKKLRYPTESGDFCGLIAEYTESLVEGVAKVFVRNVQGAYEQVIEARKLL